jgi:glycosyltransferase involved in cell wall biosynthesis
LATADATDLARALTQVWNDPDGSRAMARRARAALNQYTWPAVRNQWLDVYLERTHLNAIAFGTETR